MRWKIVIVWIVAIFATIGCSKIDDTNKGNSICFSAGYSVSTVKSTIFEDTDNFKDKNGIGGYFNVYAYKAGTSEKHFITPATVMYFTDTQNPYWSIYNPNTNKFEQRYWPIGYNLDFLAYMPVNKTDRSNPYFNIAKNCYVTIEDGPTLSAALPMTQQGQESATEFIFAWSENYSHDKQTQNGGKVPLDFIHPLSAVYFKLGGAHSGTVINSIGLANVYNKGSFALRSMQWNFSGNRENLSITVGKSVPDQLQPNSLIGGPYLVLPQAHTDNTSPVKIAVNFTWNGNTTDALVNLGSGMWMPGKKYTYTLTLGDGSEDIIVNVSIEEWDVVDYENDFEVK